MPELMQFEREKSMIRYFPPNGTAGFALRRQHAQPAALSAGEKHGDTFLFPVHGISTPLK
jgi:hypothetical protein